MKRAIVASLAVLCLHAMGCGAQEQLADVQGAVTFNGEPVKEGAIRFIPVDGNTPTAGALIKDGRFQARVPFGLMKVAISSPRVVGTQKIYDTPDSPLMPITEEAIPAQFNERTELQLEVQPGSNDKNFDLKSQ